MFLFTNLYEEIDWLEFFVYMLFQFSCRLRYSFVACSWTSHSWFMATAGSRISLCQKEAAVSVPSWSGGSSENSKSISHTDLSRLKSHLMREMLNR
jgi:hypothetical protein